MDAVRPAFEDWYRLEWPRLVTAMHTLTRDQDVARDVAAEAMSRLYAEWDRDRVENPRAWVYTVGLNLCRRRARRMGLERRILRRTRVAGTVPAPDEPSPVWDALLALPERQRTAMFLRYVADLPQHDIAQAMGVAPGTIAATLHNARRNLAATLELEEFPDAS